MMCSKKKLGFPISTLNKFVISLSYGPFTWNCTKFELFGMIFTIFLTIMFKQSIDLGMYLVETDFSKN